MKVSDLSILVVGAGSIGLRHLRNLRALGSMRLAFAEPSDERRHRVEEELGVEGHSNYGEALEAVRPDIVFVCSPTREHIPQALQAVRNGAHVFIEKPLSFSMDGIAELRRLAVERKRIVMVGCNMRFHPGPKKMKELLDGKAIGRVTRARIETKSFLPDWRSEQDYRKSYSADPLQGGAILDCIHEIDLALWYLGPATLQSAYVLPATRIGLAVDGDATLVLSHASGAVSSVHLSFVHKGYERGCAIEGEEGTILWRYGEGVTLRGKDGKIMESFPEPPAWESNRMYSDEIAYFLQCVQNEMLPFSSIAEGEAALRIALSAKHQPSPRLLPSLRELRGARRPASQP